MKFKRVENKELQKVIINGDVVTLKTEIDTYSFTLEDVIFGSEYNYIQIKVSENTSLGIHFDVIGKSQEYKEFLKEQYLRIMKRVENND